MFKRFFLACLSLVAGALAVYGAALALARSLGLEGRGAWLVPLGAALLAGTAFSWALARRLTRPLREIREVADAVRRGRLPREAPLLVRDEVDSVAAALGRMAGELSAQMDRLRAESTKLEAVISSMEDGVVALGPAGEVVRRNAAALRLLGLGDEAAGLRVWEAVRRPGLEEAARRVLGGGAPERFSLEVGPRAVALSLSPIGGGQGAVLVARDVTEERRYDTLRREFVANVSHELRTPLSLVRGYVETLAGGAWKDEARAQEFFAVIDANVRRLEAIVEDLLRLSRLESGGQVLNPRPLDLAALLGKVGEAYRPLAERKRQELAVGPAPAADGFVADPELLDRAISNLVDNAVKYTPEGGRIGIRAEATPDGVAVTVEDTGIGIPEADLPRIFERFYRVDKSRSRELGGTGLGLAIVKHVVQLHGGAVEVRSRLGQGSAFTLRLPRATK